MQLQRHTAPPVAGFRRYEVSDLLVVDVYPERVVLHRPHRFGLLLAGIVLVLALVALLAYGTERPWLLVGLLPVGVFVGVEQWRRRPAAYVIDRQTRFLYRMAHERSLPTRWLPMGQMADYLLLVAYEVHDDTVVLESRLEGPHRILLHASPQPKDHLKLRKVLVKHMDIAWAEQGICLEPAA